MTEDIDIQTLLVDLRSPESAPCGDITTSVWAWLKEEMRAWLLRSG